jgi:hypothetical protein
MMGKYGNPSVELPLDNHKPDMSCHLSFQALRFEINKIVGMLVTTAGQSCGLANGSW